MNSDLPHIDLTKLRELADASTYAEMFLKGFAWGYFLLGWPADDKLHRYTANDPGTEIALRAGYQYGQTHPKTETLECENCGIRSGHFTWRLVEHEISGPADFEWYDSYRAYVYCANCCNAYDQGRDDTRGDSKIYDIPLAQP